MTMRRRAYSRGQRSLNLNELQIPGDMEYRALKDFSHDVGEVSAYFKNLEAHLVRLISEYEIAVGCVAWLTSPRILDALAQKKVCIIVQKEDFLRPDSDQGSDELQMLYNSIPQTLYRGQFPGLMESLSVNSSCEVEPIRCVGNHNSERNPAFPRAHHKFIVFCHYNKRKTEWGEFKTVEPQAVWTGSFNFTKNAGRSLENAVYIKNKEIAQAYFDEFQQVYALSEPLDWDNEWCAPEYHIGT